MDVESYKKHFVNFASRGHLEAHFDFDVLDNPDNPRGSRAIADRIEENFKSIDEMGAPGITWRREGMRFSVDMFSYRTSAHMDFYDRLLMSVSIYRHDLNPIANRLNDASAELTQLPQLGDVESFK